MFDAHCSEVSGTSSRAEPPSGAEAAPRVSQASHVASRSDHVSAEFKRKHSRVTTTCITTLLVSAALLSYGAVGHAGESEFLKSVDGNWSGKGTVKVRVNSVPMDVFCKFTSSATVTSLSLKGKCTGLMGLSRAIGADMMTNGSTYSGSYRGAGTGIAGLNGKRVGNAIKLAIQWAKQVNGDRSARMTIEKIGSNGMRLTTVDTDPKTGKSVVTSQINLQRSF